MKSKRIIPIFFILILSLFPTPPFIESAGYGEENENLGQFTDDFENDDNVSIAVNVINNQTLDCMELNFTIGAGGMVQNFSKYTEVDSAADLTVTDRDVTWVTMRRDAVSWVVYDFGVDYFDDFLCNFTLDFSDIEAGDISNRHIMEICAFSNTIGTFADTLGGDLLTILPRQVASTDDIYRYDVRQYTGGVSDFTIEDTTNYAMPRHYGTLERSGTTITLRIYTDEARTALIETLTDTGSNQKYRYFHVMGSYDSGADGADHSSGLVANVTLEKDVGGYESNGYFITEDYLNYTTGQGLALLTNASIPIGTSMTVQFSNDNATWVDNEGNVGSTPVLDGFYAIDLRDLNYTDSFKMYNLTTGDSTITPRLFQSRLITTNGTAGAGPVGPGPTVIQNVTGEWVYYDLTTINVTVGTHDSGDLNSTLDIDGDTYNCSEVVGAPGYVIEFEWTDVDLDAHCLWVCAYIFYDGVSAHTINVDLWNFTSTAWVTIGIIYDMVDFEWVNSSIYDLRMPNDFINSTGAVRGRFYHSSAGNINDDIHTDFLKLYAFIPFENGEVVTEQSFFWIFIAIVLSIITALLVWMKYGDNNN